MVKKIVRPKKRRIEIEIPKEYVDKEIVISIKPVGEDIIEKTRGILKIDIKQWEKKREDEWDRVFD
ncbi:MAG: hypothetical protein C6H99_04850 [Epsilonproteobacteria bacterium]|nr:hypothetical protein [Campylobacterota bacterium]NPA65195.1 hypothetical protein [Campylobacterota bacterium]